MLEQSQNSKYKKGIKIGFKKFKYGNPGKIFVISTSFKTVKKSYKNVKTSKYVKF